MAATHISNERFGAIEAGGTKFVCAIGDASGALLDQWRCATADPDATLAQVLAYFRRQQATAPIERVGVGTFGPVDLNRRSPRYGQIVSTPKPGWSGVDLLGTLQRELGVEVAIDTDVNAAALGELRWGAAQGLDSLAYVTVGTGVGIGVVHGGRAVHGLMHPEAGHISLRRHVLDADFGGSCPFHGDCLEGLISGPAIQARTGKSLAEAPAEAAIWQITADYLGQLCAALVLMHSPQRILLGGGVMQQQRLFAGIRERMLAHLAGYPDLPALRAEDYVCPPSLGPEAGIKGALALVI